ncbi:hypothetical protein CKAH01_13575 [Colletotrichum kahawae]|uniref:Uncharacterized protein n=1 Tax=Colletotrichum kahawae TaxID=34407 RepID=A0AAE0DBH7_COLKA|nr:hypothetical protein CKAH01_13575 [Colletotrichum kahawae]
MDGLDGLDGWTGGWQGHKGRGLDGWRATEDRHSKSGVGQKQKGWAGPEQDRQAGEI